MIYFDLMKVYYFVPHPTLLTVSVQVIKCLKDADHDERVKLIKPDSFSCRVDKEYMVLINGIFHGFRETV